MSREDGLTETDVAPQIRVGHLAGVGDYDYQRNQSGSVVQQRLSAARPRSRPHGSISLLDLLQAHNSRIASVRPNDTPSIASSPKNQVKTVGLLVKPDGKSETSPLGELASRADESARCARYSSSSVSSSPLDQRVAA